MNTEDILAMPWVEAPAPPASSTESVFDLMARHRHEQAAVDTAAFLARKAQEAAAQQQAPEPEPAPPSPPPPQRPGGGGKRPPVVVMTWTPNPVPTWNGEPMTPAEHAALWRAIHAGEITLVRGS